MKAVAFEEFGSSEKLTIRDVPLRALKDGEVQVGIKYTSVNPVDWKIREGHLQAMLPHQFPIVTGWDAAGVITAVADDVKGWKVGDRVLAYTRLPKVHAGTYAEYINLPETYVAKVPDAIELWQAAAIPLVGLTAFQALQSVVDLKAGEKILITGGAGGVGSLAIQFAKAMGAEVTSTARKVNHGYLIELGTDHVVDYTDENSTDQLRALAPKGFDVVFDGAGGSSLDQAWDVIATGGRLVSIVDTPSAEKAEQKQVRAAFHFVEPNGAQLEQIVGLIEQGKVIFPNIEVRSVKEAAAAQDENKDRRVRGKVVLKIDF